MVLRNVAKTFSLEEQREEINEIAVDLDAVNTTLTNWNATQWDTAYSWGDHALSGYWVDNSTSRSNWDTAYGWGDHAVEGYLTAYQTDAQIKTSYEANADTNAFTDALQTKLNGIESSATADQTGAEIKVAYEGEADTNAFTDAEQTKLSGIESGATVNAATGGTSGGIGTLADPQYGSVQFRGGSTTLLGDSVFVYDTTNNKLGIGVQQPKNELHVLKGSDGGDVSLRITNQSSVDAGTSASIYLGTSPSDTFNTFYIRTLRDGGATHLGYSDPDAANHDPNIILPSTGGFEFGTQTDTAATGSTKTSATLDHYEEGTWTPIINRLGSAPTTATYTYNTGKYTRIGNVVTIYFDMNISALGGGSGRFVIAGLPFDTSTDSTSGGYGSPQFRNSTAFSAEAQERPSSYHSLDTINLRYSTSTNGEDDVTVGPGRITGWSVYFTS